MKHQKIKEKWINYRSNLILKFRQNVINRSKEIIDLGISEAGKTRPDAEAELDRANSSIDSYCWCSTLIHYVKCCRWN